MLRQYGPGTFRYETLGGKVRTVGTVPVGTIARIGVSPRNMKTRKVLVLAWLPREVAYAARYDGRWIYAGFRYVARAGHLAVVRDLATGRIERIADCYLRDGAE